MNKSLGCMAIALFLGSSLAAQPAMPEDRLESKTRQLQAGDRLEIHILTLPELEKTYLVRADGTFYHPFAGEVTAAGKTLPQLEVLLKQRFGKQLRSPAFRVGLTSTAEAEASVLGEVHAQGKFKFSEGATVMDLLAQAGGLSEKADRDSAILVRSNKQIPISLTPTVEDGVTTLKVRNGDILYVNRGKRVGVSGEVQIKGVYAIGSKSKNSIEEAVKSAGGANETAALNRVQLIRPSLAQPIVVNLLDPSQSSKVVLEDGDTVLVPPRRVVLLGAVTKPGPLVLTGKENLVDVVAAGGTDRGRLDSVVLVRSADVMSGTDKKEIYNLQESFSEGKQVVNVPIYDGDVVFIPAKEEGGGFLQNAAMVNLLLMARSFFSI